MRILLVITALFASLFAKDYYGEGRGLKIDVKPVDNELYKKECASCHFGYQPGLLPRKSWEHIMATLDKHYGTDASISDKKQKEILDYVLANASETATNYKRSRKLTASLEPGVLYTSITQIPYHKKKHRDLKEWMFTQKEVRTAANCSACHKKADLGNFGKRNVDIPNYGPWRD